VYATIYFLQRRIRRIWWNYSEFFEE